MRIALHVSDPGWLDPVRADGDATLVRSLIDELGRQGHQVHIVTQVDPLKVAKRHAPVRRLLAEPFRAWLRMRRFRPEACVVYMSSPRRPDLFCWWQRPRRYVHLYPGPRRARKPVPGRWRPFFEWVHRQAVLRADVIALYRPLAADHPPFGVGRDRIVLLPFGIRPALCPMDRDEARHRLGLPPDACIVLCVSRLLTEKEGKPDKTRAVLDLVAMADQLPSHALVAVVGDGPGRAIVETARQRLRTPARVRLEGDVPPDRVSDYYAAADIFAFPCRDDRPWVVLAEAQMHGVPVLTMRTSSAETLVQHGTGGLLADDLSAFARNLLALAADEELRRSMSSAARAYAHENLTTERWVRRVVDLLGTHN